MLSKLWKPKLYIHDQASVYPAMVEIFIDKLKLGGTDKYVVAFGLWLDEDLSTSRRLQLHTLLVEDDLVECIQLAVEFASDMFSLESIYNKVTVREVEQDYKVIDYCDISSSLLAYAKKHYEEEN